ncbi:MAG: exodeoxyribonuclease III [Selenomonadaceae bacterium]|nr:exodeoxyribonuclease III [Selenomonadaceae bacterium]
MKFSNNSDLGGTELNEGLKLQSAKKFVSWNVNGLRACLKKDFMATFKSLNADVFAIQETKMQPEQAIIETIGYKQVWNSAEKKGYSGTAVFTRIEPFNITKGIGVEEHDHEGRVITLEFKDCYFVNVYVPNSRQQLERLDYRMKWDDAFREYLHSLDIKKPVIICGDLNVAHNEIDLKNPSTNHHSNGFTDEERGKFTELLNAGFVDTFRMLYPDKVGAYTWWSYLRKARVNNSGWRIDYFLVSERIKDKIVESSIQSDIMGSDHCPVSLIIN